MQLGVVRIAELTARWHSPAGQLMAICGSQRAMSGREKPGGIGPLQLFDWISTVHTPPVWTCRARSAAEVGQPISSFERGFGASVGCISARSSTIDAGQRAEAPIKDTTTGGNTARNTN
jgi:hypothetical protein